MSFVWDPLALGAMALSSVAAPDGDHGVYPANVRPHRRTAHLRPSFFAPVAPPAVPYFSALWPARAIVVSRRAYLRPSVFAPTRFAADVVIPPIGPSGTAIAYNVEDGATITYEWPSVVRKALSGLETRASLVRTPRQHFDFTSLLTDTQMRAVLEVLQNSASSAPTFLLGLPHEELGVVSSTASTITVASLALCDWAAPGQRLVVIGQDGMTIASTWITGAPFGATIPVGSDVSATALAGARVMPALAVKLEADQGFTRSRVGLMRWKLEADAAQNGFGATTTWGTGATVTTHDGMPVWDRGNVTLEAAQPLLSGTDSIESPISVAAAISRLTRPDWARAIRVESSDEIEWQWLKAMLMTLRGRSTAFLLPTGRPDMVAVSDASTGTLTISGADYAFVWSTSPPHRRIKLAFADGSVAYRNVTSSVDNGNGTQDLTLAPAAGAIERIEFLETVHLQSDEVVVRWQGYAHESQLSAQVVQQ